MNGRSGSSAFEFEFASSIGDLEAATTKHLPPEEDDDAVVMTRGSKAKDFLLICIALSTTFARRCPTIIGDECVRGAWIDAAAVMSYETFFSSCYFCRSLRYLVSGMSFWG